jgi:hypothetical protein
MFDTRPGGKRAIGRHEQRWCDNADQEGGSGKARTNTLLKKARAYPGMLSKW